MPISYLSIEPKAKIDGHTVCFPAISQKEIPEDDPGFMKELYQTYPVINYYTQHAASTAARGKPGSFNIHSIGEDGGVINMFIRLYTGNRVLSNDNPLIRVKNFKQCLEQLNTFRTLTKLHVFFPCKSAEDYFDPLEDFCSTYKLTNGVDLQIIVYHPAPQRKQPIIKKNAEPAIKEPIKVKEAVKEPAETLECLDSQISEQSLFEVDFVRYVIKKPSMSSIFQYFPDTEQWALISQEINTLASRVPMAEVISDTVYPPANELFNAFTLMQTQPKIILLGQEPYTRKGQSNGLAYSVHPGVPIPPSLKNIYKALANNVDNYVAPKHGNLSTWAEQGVLLLNISLTVVEGTAGSHTTIWEPFTNDLITLLSQKYSNLVFMLWGAKAKAKKQFITGNHLVLECQHPSPQIANNTFETDCTHFNKANEWLKSHGKTPIIW